VVIRHSTPNRPPESHNGSGPRFNVGQGIEVEYAVLQMIGAHVGHQCNLRSRDRNPAPQNSAPGRFENSGLRAALGTARRPPAGPEVSRGNNVAVEKDSVVEL